MAQTDSTNAERVACPHCGGRTAAGAFCDRCGKELNTTAGPPTPHVEPSGVGDGLETFPGPSGGSAAGFPPAPPAAPTPAVTPAVVGDAARPVPGPQVVEEASVGAQTRSGWILSCEYLNIESDRRQVFVENMPTPLRFRITPLKPGLENLSIWVLIEFASGESSLKQKLINWKTPRVGDKRTCLIPFLLNRHGVHSTSLFFGFRHGGVDYIYTTEHEIPVYPADSSASQVLRDLSININTEISAGHAADVHVQNSRDQIEGLARSLKPESRIIEVIDQLRKGTPAYCTLELFPSMGPPRQQGEPALSLPDPPAGPPPAEALQQCLTLHYGQQRIHLMGMETITLGKSRRGNGLVTRLFDANGEALLGPNALLSRLHCRLSRRPDGLLVEDVGQDAKGSTCGTFLDGKRVLQGAGAIIAPNASSAILSLAGADALAEGVFALHLSPWTCEEGMRRTCRQSQCRGDREVAALILRRRDEVRECFLALWACFPLKLLFPEFDGLTLWRRDGAFAWSRDDQRGWITPGASVPADNLVLCAGPWHQHGIEPTVQG